MKRTNDVLVGSAILAAIVLTTSAAVWVSQADLGRHRQEVTARFRDVGGIQLGDAVVIRGVRSGRVDRVELADEGWVLVRLRLEGHTELPIDPVVLLNESSLFGEWQATVTEAGGVPADRDVRARIAEARGEPGVLPGATLPDVAQLTTVAGRIAGDVASVAARVQVAFDDTAAVELRGTLRNFNDLSGELARTVRRQSRNLDSVAAGIDLGLQGMNEAVASVRRVAQRLDTATAGGQTQRAIDDVAAAAAELRATTAELHALVAQVSQAQGGLTSVVARADSIFARVNAGEGSLGLLVNDPSLYQSSDSLMRELRLTVADFRRDPRRYIRLRVF